MIINDWLYVNSSDNTARFALGIHGDNPLFCFGINPSTAAPDNLDATIKRVQDFAKSNGHNSWIMLNVYPKREKNPECIDVQCNDDLHNENIKQITKVINKYLDKGNITILAGWGASIENQEWLLNKSLIEIINRIKDIASNCKWVCLGKTKNGHPRHPLFVNGTEKFQDFDIKVYMEKCMKSA
ncbi:MAG: DUF1643 domain-containing protein [Treponema sp.]|jgi:hypothetical protein|nr:DUF1643 domain-containing protein [Treponema sp.]